MTSDRSTNATWQKVSFLSAVFAIALPIAAKYAWHILFPPEYLLYEVTPTVHFADVSTGSVVVTNAGYATQESVAVYIPTKAADPSSTLIDVSEPSQTFLFTFIEVEPEQPLSKSAHSGGSKLILGRLMPDESIRITFAARKTSEPRYPLLSLEDVRVESKSTTATFANSPRRPQYADDAHHVYTSLSPYMLGMLLGLTIVVVLVAMLYEYFFDTPQKKMTRLWRQMDTLQEYIEKERRYQ